jgi:hypothetical protein
MSTYTHYTAEDDREWDLEITGFEPYHAGSYWDPPEGGFVYIEGDVVESLPRGHQGPPECLDLDAWRARYGITDKAFADIEDKAYQAIVDAQDEGPDPDEIRYLEGMAKLRLQIPNQPDRRHLLEVKDEMRRRGSPRIRAVRTKKGWVALEGSHRVTAAQKLGIPIILIEKKPDDRMTHDIWTGYGRPELPIRATVARILEEFEYWGRPVRRTVLVIR